MEDILYISRHNVKHSHNIYPPHTYIYRVGKKAMARLLGIVHMNPETDSSKWSHEEVSFRSIADCTTCFGCGKHRVLSFVGADCIGHVHIHIHTHTLNLQCYFTNSIVLQEDFYGLGTVRTPEKFYETFGIDVRKKKTVKFLCRFVEGGKMHHLFMPNLRSDGMGIDYSKITYKHS